MVANTSCGIRMASNSLDSMLSPRSQSSNTNHGSASPPIGTCMPSWELADSLPSLLDESAGRKGAIAGGPGP